MRYDQQDPDDMKMLEIVAGIVIVALLIGLGVFLILREVGR